MIFEVGREICKAHVKYMCVLGLLLNWVAHVTLYLSLLDEIKTRQGNRARRNIRLHE